MWYYWALSFVFLHVQHCIYFQQMGKTPLQRWSLCRLQCPTCNAPSQWMDLISQLQKEVASLQQCWAQPLDRLALCILTVLSAPKHDFQTKWIGERCQVLCPSICSLPTMSGQYKKGRTTVLSAAAVVVVLYSVSRVPLWRCCWSLLLCCQEALNAAAPHFGQREGEFVYVLCYCWQAWDISHHWQGWVHKLWEVLLIQYWRAADILYFCPVILQLLLLQSQHCSYLTAVLTGSTFLSMYRKGSACWPSCYSSTGAHCYASIQWHVQPVHEEGYHATLHWAILAWTKSTVPVSWANSARKGAEEGKTLENYNLQGQVQTLCSHLLLESWNTAMPKTLTHRCNFCFSTKGGGSGTITLPTTGKASPTSKAN